MDKDEIIRQLKRENESLKACIKELEAKLAMYENAHTPPSLKRGGKRKKIRINAVEISRGRRRSIKA